MKSRLLLILVLVAASDTLYRVDPLGGQTGMSSDIGLTVVEPAGVVRANAPVTSGVPIPAALTGARWALFEGPTEVPLQTTVLPGRTPWLLLDFQTSLSSHGARLFTLKPVTPAATLRQPLAITEDASQVTIVTGPIQAQISKTSFNLLETVWTDQDGDGRFRDGERVVLPASVDNLHVHDASTDQDYSGRGAADFEWEDRGPLRATLRVDGSYRRGAATLLDYTARLTFWAGSPEIQVDMLIRNSSQAEERYVKLRSAKLDVGRPTTTHRLARSGAQLWTSVPAGGVSIEMIPDTMTVTMQYDPYASPPVPRSNATINVDANGGLIVGDLSYHGGTVVLDFTSGLSGSQQAQRAESSRYPLLALAPPQWYSDLGAFGSDRFGTYDDEKQCYRQWGWVWPTPGQCWSYEHDLPLYRDYDPSWRAIDSEMDPESDDLWSNLIMMARTSLYPYFLRAQGWARYMKWECAFRTDGFPYAGNDSWDGPNPVFRPLVMPTSLTAADQAYIANNIKRGKVQANHTWNGGLVDYYYLTGDRDALQAALDLAEQSARYQAWRTPGAVDGMANGRFEARAYMNSLRAWDGTQDPQWRTSGDHIRDLFLQSGRYDPRGFYYKPTCEIDAGYCARFPNGKFISPFEVAIIVQAFHLDYVQTGDPRVRQRLLEMAAGADQFGSDSTGYTGDVIVIDSPTYGTVSHLSLSEFANTPPVTHRFNAASSVVFIDALTIGHRLTGSMPQLRHAKLLWDRASKGEPGQTFATATQVGRFMNSVECWGKDSYFFPNSGDITSTQFLFYDGARADLTPPADISTLSGHR